MVKTSIDIENLKEIKKICIDLDTTVKDLVDAALKEYLARRGIKIKGGKK